MILDAAALRQHLDTLYASLHEGALLGLPAGLHRLRRDDVQALLDKTAPSYGDEETQAAFCAAGPTLVYGALALAYSQRVEMLAALGEDTRAERARLRRCLYDLAPAELTTPVWQPSNRRVQPV